jgi:hypothetical protein
MQVYLITAVAESVVVVAASAAAASITEDKIPHISLLTLPICPHPDLQTDSSS